jgi:hypothetical protein
MKRTEGKVGCTRSLIKLADLVIGADAREKAAKFVQVTWLTCERNVTAHFKKTWHKRAFLAQAGVILHDTGSEHNELAHVPECRLEETRDEKNYASTRAAGPRTHDASLSLQTAYAARSRS